MLSAYMFEFFKYDCNTINRISLYLCLIKYKYLKWAFIRIVFIYNIIK